MLRGPAAQGHLRLAQPRQLRDLYAQGAGAVAAPYFAYNHREKVVPGETCTTGSSAISGLAFYTGDQFPAAYKDALFFTDYSRNCIWVDVPGRERAAGHVARGRRSWPARPDPVLLTQGPDGAL